MITINTTLSAKTDVLNWITIQEAINIATQENNTKLTDSDIYRHALYGNINLSIYFQSPVALRKIQTTNSKVRLQPIENSLINQLCILDRNCFLNNRNLIVSTAGKYIHPGQRVIDTTLLGYEYVLVQRLLAGSLGIPLPITGDNYTNYGLSVTLCGDIFQVFDNSTWQERIEKQTMQLPEDVASHIAEQITLPYQRSNRCCHRGYFPIHDLPTDACFVIRHTELEKLMNMPVKNAPALQSATRISTPLSRLFWLACKHNEAISPLIRQPYKLLSIFEQWASAEGITDRLNGDTLKTALERGSPTSVSARN